MVLEEKWFTLYEVHTATSPVTLSQKQVLQQARWRGRVLAFRIHQPPRGSSPAYVNAYVTVQDASYGNKFEQVVDRVGNLHVPNIRCSGSASMRHRRTTDRRRGHVRKVQMLTASYIQL